MNWWDLVPAVVGAVIGAATGAFPAFWLARRSSEEVLRRDCEQRLDDDKQRAFQLQVKLIETINSLYTLHIMTEEMVTQAAANGHAKMELWQKVKPIAAVRSDNIPGLTADELSFVLKAGDSDLVNELILFFKRAIAVTEGFAEYASIRLAFTNDLSARMEGEVGTTTMTQEQFDRFAPRATQVESLITQLRDMVRREFEHGAVLAERFTVIANDFFGGSPKFAFNMIGSSVALTPPPPTPAAPPAAPARVPATP